MWFRRLACTNIVWIIKYWIGFFFEYFINVDVIIGNVYNVNDDTNFMAIAKIATSTSKATRRAKK